MAATTFSIMPLGDSITDGAYSNAGQGGYRLPMVTNLINTYHFAGANISLVGTKVDTSIPNTAYQHHDGHSGWTLEQIARNLTGAPIATDDSTANGGYWLAGGNGQNGKPNRAAIHPTYVTIMGGVNDVDSFIGGSTIAHPMSEKASTIESALETRMTGIVNAYKTLSPSTTILLSNTIPYANGLLNAKLFAPPTDDSDGYTHISSDQLSTWAAIDGVNVAQEQGVNHFIITFNKWLKNTFIPQQQAAGANIRFVDQYSNFINTDGTVGSWGTAGQNLNNDPADTAHPNLYGDYGLHPNQTGYDRMGATWAAAINAVQVPEPTTAMALLAMGGFVLSRRRCS